MTANAHHSTKHNTKVVRKLFGRYSGAALRVAGCETGGRIGWTFATGRAGERGIFQIHPIWRYRFFDVTGYHWHQAYLPKANAKFAFWLSQGGRDWSHWTCRWAA